MTYATKQDLIDRFGATEFIQLTDRVNRPPTTIDDVVVSRALSDTHATINGYLGKIYKLPLSVIPDVLVKIASDIARYFLHGETAPKDGNVYLAYLAAVAWLKDVAKGLVTIDAEGVTPAATGGGAIRANPSDRVFTRKSLRSF